MNDNKEEVAEVQDIIKSLTKAPYEDLVKRFDGKNHLDIAVVTAPGHTVGVDAVFYGDKRKADLTFMTPVGIDLVHSSGMPNGLVVEAVKETVDHPMHYQSSGVECIEAIASATEKLTGQAAFCAGNVIKYVWRFKDKNGVEDLKKASWYLDRLIKVVEKCH